jgi:hypothetical protein
MAMASGRAEAEDERDFASEDMLSYSRLPGELIPVLLIRSAVTVRSCFHQGNSRMAIDWPDEVVAFEDFLKNKGLTCQRREKLPSFGDKLVQFSGEKLAVRVFSERAVWFVDVADAAHPQEWYDAGILRDLILGPSTGAMPLADQIKLVKENWSVIVDSFTAPQLEETRKRLAGFEQHRAKRLFPGLTS